MACKRNIRHVCFYLFFASTLTLKHVSCVRQSELYEFGDAVGDEKLPKGDDVIVNVSLQTPINLFGESYNSIHVSTNGLVSFLTPVERYINVQFPLNIPVIAPLYANADTSYRGQVYYRESNREADLSKSHATLRHLFADLSSDFDPLGLFIVTWEQVPMYGADSYGADKANTFQLAITTDGEMSFVEFLYHDGGIQWIKAPNANPYDNLPPVRAQVGIVSPSGRYFLLRGSGSDQVMNLDKWTNGDKAGQYVFRISSDDSDRSEIVDQPHIARPDDGESEGKSCAEGYLGCHSDAECVDQPQGVCCICRPPYIGNGISCLKNDQPIRFSGPLSINLNGVRLENLLFEGYIVVKDGRVYTAVDSLPPSLGPSLQLLKPIESLPGWLFALTGDTNKKNGFQLTGAVVNHTATLTYPNSNVVRLHQIYSGPDAFDQIKVEVDISGWIPDISPNVVIKHSEYEEMYTKTEPGVYRSTNVHSYKLSTGENIEVSVEQMIQFKENCHSQEESAPHRLVSNRNFLTYKDPILRFAGFHKLGNGPVSEDPCIKGRAQCVANSSCLVKGDTYKCVCNSGFETEYYGDSGDQLGCVDVNECQERTANCHENALCINEIGTFSCECHSGFSGDGTHCEPIKPNVADRESGLPTAIPANMYCSDNENIESCVCAQGYEIQHDPNSNFGIACVDIDECSRLAQVCSTYADCYNFGGGFECRCQSGFQGDGRSCVPAGCGTIACPSGTVCEDRYGEPTCVCPFGYTGSPPSCFPSYEHSYNDECAADEDCPELAKCLSSLELRLTTCICPDGTVVGQVGRCLNDSSSPRPSSSPSSEVSQRLLRTCHEGKCWCPPGYADDGQYCVQDGLNSREPYYRPPQPPSPPTRPPPPPPPRPYPRPARPETSAEDPNSCHVLHNCHKNALCVRAMRVDDGYRCMCNPGYEGDGYNCTESELSCHDADICHKNAVCVENNAQGSSHVCICSDGFIGDGFICYPSGQCTDDADCDEYGVCEYNDEKEVHECGCRRGYVKESSVCVPEKDSAVCAQCDANAVCVLKNGAYDCQCKDTFRGDGFSCTPEIQGCDVLRDCDANAQCLYSAEVEGYSCQCRQGFTGDGHTCEEIVTCARDPGLCDDDAQCLYIDSRYMCKCNEGYFGNGTVCKEAAVQDEQFLLLTKGGSILRVPLSPTRDDSGIPINIRESQVAVGITTDCVEGKVYWSDITNAQINRAKYDGSEFEEFLHTKGESPEGLALDWIHRKLYWVDPATDKISRIDLDTKEVEVIIDRNLTNPRGIAVHPFRRKLYWSDWNRAAPKIEESNLDGSQRRDLVTGTDVKLPNALTIDWERDELCWSDAGTKTIDCMYLNRRVPNTVVKNTPYPFGLAISSDKYYWSDWNTLKIMSAPKATGEPISLIAVPLGGDDKPNKLTIVTACPR